MSESADFRDVQYAFAAYLRDPAKNPPPAGIEERRLAIYRDLFFSNIENFARSFFPVLRSLYGEEDWRALVRDFLSRHCSRSPYFLDIAGEFIQYLEHERGEHPADPPFLRELAHYEWLELLVDVDESGWPSGDVDVDGDLLAGVPVLAPALVLACYNWPVHRINAANRPATPLAGPVWLAVYRDRAEAVRFLELNTATARLVELMRAGESRSGRELGLQLATEMSHPAPEALVSAAGDMLALLRERGMLAGTLPATG